MGVGAPRAGSLNLSFSNPLAHSVEHAACLAGRPRTVVTDTSGGEGGHDIVDSVSDDRIHIIVWSRTRARLDGRSEPAATQLGECPGSRESAATEHHPDDDRLWGHVLR
ncbi:hypothetical protein Rhow_002364 [Rhodococcus wratislaviensis]|uniref:Uncharacterized protein n=1 Tax=Rhodococcus wratislaviensis TaxID=44752 RepID=A0A402C5E0_RHOWR|nr:hypothetical protein Rhow_002364 [Rhodococcus wratislaviensis]